MKVVTVVTNDASCIVTWRGGAPDVQEGPLHAEVQSLLSRERDFPVGDTPSVPGATAGYWTERRLPENEFEMVSVLLQMPYESPLSVTVSIHDSE